MDIINEVLKELKLEELLGTDLKKSIVIKSMKAKEEILDIEYSEKGAIYLYRGLICSNTHSIEGKDAYRYYEKGHLIGMTESMSEGEISKMYGTDLKIIEDSILVFLPLRKVFSEDIEGKERVYQKLFNLCAWEKGIDTDYLLGKIVYSDEEFFLKALEHMHTFDMTTLELAKALNMGVRNLQRHIKNYIEMGILEKNKNIISIKDMEKFKAYKEKMLK